MTPPLPTDGDDRTVPMPGRATGDGPQPSAPPTIPGVVLGAELARGGMGVVYTGVQEYLDRKVAVKVLAAHLQGPEFVQRFRREAQILAGLSHPHLVACHGAGVTAEGHCYMVMEFIDGPTLRKHCEEHGPLHERDAVRLVSDVAQALQHAHDAGIIHRDVKPENVLLQRDERRPGPFAFVPKLVDLGIARHVAAEQQLTAPGVVMGTVATMAPEQFDDPDHVDHRADIYGLGCVAFHALTGRPAFAHGNLTATMSAKAAPLGPDPTLVNPRVSPRVARFVRSMMARNPAERPATYAALLDACAGLLGPARPARRGLRWIGTLLAAVAGFGVWWGTRPAAPVDDHENGAKVAVPDPTPAKPEPTPEPAKQPVPEPEPPRTSDPGLVEQGQDQLGPAEPLFATDLKTKGWTTKQPDQKETAFVCDGDGVVNAICKGGEARCTCAIPKAFELVGTIELKPEWEDGRAEAAGIELVFPNGPSLCLWVEQRDSVLHVHLGTRDAESWPPIKLVKDGKEQSLPLPDAPQVDVRVTSRAANLVVVLGFDRRALEVELNAVVGDCQLALVVRRGFARFRDFSLRK